MLVGDTHQSMKQARFFMMPLREAHGNEEVLPGDEERTTDRVVRDGHSQE